MAVLNPPIPPRRPPRRSGVSGAVSSVGNIAGPVVSPVPAAASSIGSLIGSTVSPTAAAATSVGSLLGGLLGAPATRMTNAEQLRQRYLGGNVGRKKQTPQQRILAKVPSYVPEQYRASVAQAASRYGVRPELLAAQLQQESGFDPNAVSPAGAEGIAQFMAGTAASVGLKNPSDPHASILAQGRLMGQLLNQFGSEKLALAAYNAGAGAVQSAGGVPAIPETQNYVQTILSAAGKGGSNKYVYPFGPNIQIGRTDMGIDPYGPGPIRAIGRAKYLGEGGSGWPTEGGSGTGPVYKLLKGPLAGQNVYTYEGITPNANLSPGDILHKGQVIAKSTGQDFETGFAQGRAAGFQPTASPHYSEGDVTPEGQAFANLVNRLGTGGAVSGGVGSFSPATAGSLTSSGYSPTPGSSAGGGTSPSASQSRSAPSMGDALVQALSMSPKPGGLLGQTIAGMQPQDQTASDLYSQLQGGRFRPQRRLSY